ncbi:hypothetical protein FJT64_020747 [Amphibalanus amphitrite]|uniref:Zinc finger BED domain-containing protein 4 n=1 Tax=Amphibalanus amphitrite TaxID=1232801 RepID=A0A6A4X0L6_AMPAM|nr:hypothetical protein FJT64_020747 [Amphibalanus amphitrite]
MKKAFQTEAVQPRPKESFCSFDTSADEDGESHSMDPDDELQAVAVASVLEEDANARPVAARRTACACHTIQLVVQDGLRSLPDSASRQIMEQRGGVLHTANVTRWNSQLRTVASYLTLKKATPEELGSAVPSIASKVVDQAGWKVLEQLVEALHHTDLIRLLVSLYHKVRLHHQARLYITRLRDSPRQRLNKTVLF